MMISSIFYQHLLIPTLKFLSKDPQQKQNMIPHQRTKTAILMAVEKRIWSSTQQSLACQQSTSNLRQSTPISARGSAPPSNGENTAFTRCSRRIWRKRKVSVLITMHAVCQLSFDRCLLSITTKSLALWGTSLTMRLFRSVVVTESIAN